MWRFMTKREFVCIVLPMEFQNYGITTPVEAFWKSWVKRLVIDYNFLTLKRCFVNKRAKHV